MKEIRINYKELIDLQKQGENKVYEYLYSIGFEADKPISNQDNEIERYRVFTQKD